MGWAPYDLKGVGGRCKWMMARNCFYWFASVSLKRSPLFVIVSFEKNCSQQLVVPNTDAYFMECFLKVGKSSSLM